MHFSTALPFFLLSVSSVLATPRAYRRRQLSQPVLSLNASTVAGGSIPNAPSPANVSTGALTGFQAANFLENLELSFFSAGIANITVWGTAGFPDNTLEVVSKVAAQEAVHVATIETVLAAFNTSSVPPCSYIFPSTSTAEFLALAQIITSVGIGAVIDTAASFALTDPALVAEVASIVTVEARHDAFFRTAALPGAVPNPTPFDTRISSVWALNLAMQFVMPGSCPMPLNFPVFPPMTVVTAGNATFSAAGKPVMFQTSAAALNATAGPLFVGWVNQANTPVYTQVISLGGGVLATYVPEGLAGIAFAALTTQEEALDVAALTKETVAGPAIVQVS